MITKNEHLKKIFTAPPMPALRQPPNLRNIICKSKLFDKDRMETSEDKIGWQKCENKENAKNPCRICAYTFDDTKKITSKGNNTTHTIKGNLSCKTSNGIYYWYCKNTTCKLAPHNEYVGKTKRSYQERKYNHICYIRSKKTDEVSGKHFCQKDHTIHDMKGLLIEKVHSRNPVTLKFREHYYINKFDTFRNGLNRE